MTRLRKIMLEELERRNYSEVPHAVTYVPSLSSPATSIALRTGCAPSTSVNTKRICSGSENWMPAV